MSSRALSRVSARPGIHRGDRKALLFKGIGLTPFLDCDHKLKNITNKEPQEKERKVTIIPLPRLLTF